MVQRLTNVAPNTLSTKNTSLTEDFDKKEKNQPEQRIKPLNQRSDLNPAT